MLRKKKKINKEKINFRYNLREYWNLLKKYKKKFFLVLILTLFVEGLLVADKYLFKIIIDKGTLFAEGSLAKEIFIEILIVIVFVFIGIILMRTLLRYFVEFFTQILEGKLILDVKEKYFNHILNLSHNFHTTHKTGSLISRMNRGSGAVENMTDILIFEFAPLLFNLAVVGFSLAIFTITPALVIFGIAIAFIGYSFIIQQLQQDSKLKFNRARDNEKGFISDIFTNIDSIKYFGKEKSIQKRFFNVADKTKLRMLNYWRYYRWFSAGHIFILGIGSFLLVYFPVIQLLAGEITLGTLVFIFTVYGNVIGPMFGFVGGLRSFYRATSDFQELFEYGKIENEIKDKTDAKELKIKKGKIEFKDISFDYGRKKAFNLKDFNLKIKPNEKVAFVGHSGCGKSTLIKLLYRLYDVQKGQILIDKKDIRNVKQKSLRSELSIVPQEAILFDDTIFNNIKFSNPKASREEVWKAIKFAQLGEFIENLPQKERTIVGERGVKLSGGEKQRVSIARAILADKRVLILDEATSSLDSETEHEIQKDLKRLLEGRTSIIIAHRLSTIMNADRIIVMKRGKIIQQGSHNKLIKQIGEYNKLWNMQKGGYIK